MCDMTTDQSTRLYRGDGITYRGGFSGEAILRGSFFSF